MRYKLISVGKYAFYDEPYYRGLIGGRIVATNPDTGEEISQYYKKFHTGKTNKFDVLAQLMYKVAPPQKEEEKDEAFIEEESDNEDSSEETYVAENISKGNI